MGSRVIECVDDAGSCRRPCRFAARGEDAIDRRVKTAVCRGCDLWISTRLGCWRRKQCQPVATATEAPQGVPVRTSFLPES